MIVLLNELQYDRYRNSWKNFAIGRNFCLCKIPVWHLIGTYIAPVTDILSWSSSFVNMFWISHVIIHTVSISYYSPLHDRRCIIIHDRRCITILHDRRCVILHSMTGDYYSSMTGDYLSPWPEMYYSPWQEMYYSPWPGDVLFSMTGDVLFSMTGDVVFSMYCSPCPEMYCSPWPEMFGGRVCNAHATCLACHQWLSRGAPEPYRGHGWGLNE